MAYRLLLPEPNMKIQIDLKSVALGLLVGVGAMFALGADSSSPNQIGRYQISAGQSSAFIVDTTTGQSWGFEPNNTTQYRQDGNFFSIKGQ
jgi:hypothetical protein